MPILLLALFVVRGLTSFVSTYCMAWVGSRLVMDLRAAMFDKLMALPTRYFDQHPSGQLIAQLAFNVTQVTQSATSSLTTLVRDTVTVLGLLGYLLWLNWQLTLIVFALVPLTLVGGAHAPASACAACRARRSRISATSPRWSTKRWAGIAWSSCMAAKPTSRRAFARRPIWRARSR